MKKNLRTSKWLFSLYPSFAVTSFTNRFRYVFSLFICLAKLYFLSFSRSFSHASCMAGPPRFFPGKDNYGYFEDEFSKKYKGGKGKPVVVLLDNDMHAICRLCGKYGPSSELNPADSHGVF